MKKQNNAIIGIYKIINPLNKVYIGQSTHIENREKHYQGNHCHLQIKLYNSIKKYGWKQHKFEIIEQCILEMLNERERYWQDYYDVLGVNGVNCRLTETKDKSGFLSIETRNKISKIKKGCNIWSKGKKFSNEHCLKISQSKKGKSLPSLSYINNKNNIKPIIQYDLNGNYIKEWTSAVEAASFYNKTPESIRNCCNNKCKTSNGFIWKNKKN